MMTTRRIAATLASAAPVLAGPAATPGVAAAADPGPPLTQPTALMADATWCDPSVQPGSGKQAVLLVHGTGMTPDEAWGRNHERAPRSRTTAGARSHRRAVGEFVVSAEYTVHAARYPYRQSGRPIAGASITARGR
ncbi:hypothetical protein [Pseudonocardia sp. WMMC193]|uniref:hypothetical protein n=1 Tax=Pseudonocardia sp. WMMC193 TaxID=2911965 RepID=UPI001F27BA84|nr:hypothetical protein [Pseudonocardia sp. WMMC193]MCF7550838.1 hypothetical protein [Pseudonocardia sp. WMMC193]